MARASGGEADLRPVPEARGVRPDSPRQRGQARLGSCPRSFPVVRGASLRQAPVRRRNRNRVAQAKRPCTTPHFEKSGTAS